MVTYFASANATSAKTAYFQFREPTVVTASASATATSTLSQANANQIAQQTAQQIADNTVENDVNLMVQTVDVATVGDTIFGLDSSLLSNFITKTSVNTYTLNADFEVRKGLGLNIRTGQTLNIQNGCTLSTNVGGFIRNLGTINLENESALLCGKTIDVGGSAIINREEQLPLTEQINHTTSVPAITNNGTINISSTSYLIIRKGETFDNGTDNYSATSQIQMYGGLLLNYGTCNNYGIINGEVQDISNNIMNGVSRTVGSISYVPTANVNFNNYGLIQNALGILNGDTSNNGIISYFTNETTFSTDPSMETLISINGVIVNNSNFLNKLEKSTIMCSGFSNYSTFVNNGFFETLSFDNISISFLDCSAIFTNYNNFECNYNFYVAVGELSNYASIVSNKANTNTSGNMELQNINQLSLTFEGILENDLDCSFNCTTNGFINSNTITNNGNMIFGTPNPTVTSLTNDSNGTIINHGTIYCGSFFNEPGGTLIGTPPIPFP